MTEKKQKFLPEHFFMAITVISALFSVFWLAKTGGRCLDTIISGSGNDKFMDFFNHISYVREPTKVYFTSQHACFPPLIYFMYYLFSIILSADATVMYDSFATSSFAMLLYVSYCAFLAVLLFYSILKLMRRENLEFSLVITLIVVISNIYIFGILERGNSAIIVCILLLRAMELRERKSPIAQELALLFIAMAAAIKIYPAIFGFIYLRRNGKKLED